MVPSSIWALTALLPLISTANGLVFELSPHANKRQTQHHRLAQKAKRATPVLPATWAYDNCYTDGANRALAAVTTNTDTMTVDYCVNWCNSAGYIYAGLEYSRECYCDNAIQNGNTVATDGCTMMCNGDATQVCGGGFRLSVYKSSKPLPSALATYSGWGYQGCYTDSAAARTLTVPMGVTAPLTPQKCLDACHTAGYTYSGLEYSVECYCGNGLSNGGILATDATTCDMACAGDSSHLCGGGNRLSLYEYGVPAVGQTTTTTTAGTTTTTTTTQAASTTSQATTTTTTTTTTAAAAASTTASGPSTLAAYNGWTSVGCYVDSVAARTIPNGIATTGGPAAMTVELCLDGCHAAGYTIAGLEYSQECYCSNAMPPQPATDGRCDMVCNGNPLEYCGGGNGLTVYSRSVVAGTTTTTTTTTTTAAATTTTTTAAATTTTTTTAAATTTTTTAAATTTTASGPSTLAAYNGWTSTGCYVDSVAARTIPNGMGVTGGPAAMTVQLCLDACHAAGYTVAGLEYSQECYCGTALPPVAATDGRCNMVCNGNHLEYCGGSNGLTVYTHGVVAGTTTTTTTTTAAATTTTTTAAATTTATTTASTTPATTTTTTTAATTTQTGPSILPAYGNWISQGCWSDDPASRSLSITLNTNGANSVEACADACYNAGYPYAGVEYSAECYCGNGIVNAGALETDDGCNMVCQAKPLEYCGGPFRLNVYKYNGVVPPPTTPPPPPPGGGATTGTGLGPVTSGLPTPWAYAGCYVDNQFGRILGLNEAPNGANTPATCIATCAGLGYTLAGVEYGDECYCGNALANAATKSAADSDCAMACAGDATHACGGPNRVSLYSAVASFTTYPVPSAVKTNLVGEYSYTGCYAEPGGALRVFPYQITNTTGNTVQQCLTLCSSYGYDAAALEYGQECWCGDANTIAAAGGAPAPETDCNMPCTGSPADLCGGVARFNLYTWSSTTNPLYTFNTPANTGHYELLIGGIVIPLIATLGLNNKVTFMEKYGTGAPNSTGAYELDYQLADDYTKAWRVMHVQSDVFCAANLVLPDRSGRILSVGGWSDESTQGVRLYTPSGSTGVNGTTDWEEHWDQIHLQQGRWYPGAMQMANGSVMVIGGEAGSNGAPVPSIEVLPKVAGGPTYLTMDWLLATDPNNLYPFTFILPGGGIFVIYYNQARILDETTFNTIKTLPTIPGAVNAVGGRTYPMEGTAMVLPQHYPFSDPVEIIACGGSAFGQAFDNCASIIPESADPEWVIERMPTKRVMTIMTALPDGTYFIAGGAESGVAGFGLANTPNLSALLYDPSKPRNQRISILGNTIVARLYHSEAILLHDGRILITGSDPEDNVNPQEYRMEVYVPPYRTDGSTPPTYTIPNRDWTYNLPYQFTVTSTIKNSIKVSLMGGVSTTHGNSFGQRTIFPLVSCQGTQCTVTAPPDVHKCPPGWYQMFILDGPTPSYSQWIRIGGDPGSIGNWPNYPGFVLPGVGGI